MVKEMAFKNPFGTPCRISEMVWRTIGLQESVHQFSHVTAISSPQHHEALRLPFLAKGLQSLVTRLSPSSQEIFSQFPSPLFPFLFRGWRIRSGS